MRWSRVLWLSFWLIWAFLPWTYPVGAEVGGHTVSIVKPQVKIEFWHAMDGKRGKVLHELVAAFNQSHPGIQVADRFKGGKTELTNDYASLYREILGALSRGHPPAVAQVYENWTTQLIGVGALTPVAELLDGGVEVNDFIPTFVKANRFGGKLWTLPFNKSVYVLYYNRKMFAEAGLAPPGRWEEFPVVCRLLTKKLSVPGLVFKPGVDEFGHYLLANGGRFFQGDKVTFSGELGRRDMRFWYDLVYKDKAALASMRPLVVFSSGGAAMVVATTSKLLRLESALGPELGVTLLPAGEDGLRAYQMAGTNLAVFKKISDEQRVAVKEFLRYLVSPKVLLRWAKMTGYLPVRRSVLESGAYKMHIRQHPQFAVGVKALPFLVVQPRTAGWESVRGIIDDAMMAVLGGRLAPGEAVDGAAVSAQRLISSLRGGL